MKSIQLQSVIDIIKSESEFPEPCPNLKALIKQAIEEKDEEWLLHMCRQTVRQTKECILTNIQNLIDNNEQKTCEKCGRILPTNCPPSVYSCTMGTGCADYTNYTKTPDNPPSTTL